MLIAGRAVQGTGGGGLLILVNICTSDLFSMRTRGLVYGMESLIWAAAAALGPVLGGVFAELVDWRWCFYIARRFARVWTEITSDRKQSLVQAWQSLYWRYFLS